MCNHPYIGFILRFLSFRQLCCVTNPFNISLGSNQYIVFSLIFIACWQLRRIMNPSKTCRSLRFLSFVQTVLSKDAADAMVLQPRESPLVNLEEASATKSGDPPQIDSPGDPLAREGWRGIDHRAAQRAIHPEQTPLRGAATTLWWPRPEGNGPRGRSTPNKPP